MAVNESRSMNRELAEGLSDGVVKKLTPDRGGATDSSAVRNRNSGLSEQYGMGQDSGTSEARRLTTVHG